MRAIGLHHDFYLAHGLQQPEYSTDFIPRISDSAAVTVTVCRRKDPRGQTPISRFGKPRSQSRKVADDRTYQYALPFFKVGAAHFADAANDGDGSRC